MSDPSTWTYIDFEAAAPLYKDCVDPAVARIIQVGVVRPADAVRYGRLVNPGFSLPPEITGLTGIADADLAGADDFSMVAMEVADLIAGRTVAGYNCNRYDIPLLAEEFERCGLNFDWKAVTVIDIGNLFKIMRPSRLTDAYEFYTGGPAPEAHDAVRDADMTAAVALSMLARHAGLGEREDASLALMASYERRAADPAGKLSYDDAGRLVYNTFRNKGVPVADDLGYADWMMRQNFPRATKKFLAAELDRIRGAGGFGFDDDPK